jgi:hypothetical protein
MEKYYSLHSRFHYVNPLASTASLNPSSSSRPGLNPSAIPPPVTFNGKLFFATLTDCNRYCAFLRVICCKIMKFLTIKKLYFYSTCFKRWKSAIYDFKESDLVNSHINTRLLEEREKEEKRRNDGKLLTISEIKEKMEKEGEIQLMSFLLANSEETADGKAGEKEGETATKRKIRHDLLPSLDDLRSLPLSVTSNTNNNHLTNPSLTLIPNFAEYRQKQKIASAVKDDESFNSNNNILIIDDKALLKMKNDEIATSTIFHRPTSSSENDPPSEERGQHNDEQKNDSLLAQSKTVRIPGYNPSEGVPLPILPCFSRPKTFKDRLYFDLINQPALLSGSAIASSSSSSSSSSAASSSSVLVNPIFISKDDYYNPTLIHQHSSEYLFYRAILEGSTSESYWLIPSILMIGNIPYGNANKQYFEKIPLNFGEVYEQALREEEIEKGEKGENERTQASFSHSTDTTGGAGGGMGNQKSGGSSEKWTVKGTALTAISALLLSGIDTFISILSEKDEQLLQYYYQSKKSIEELLNESLERTKSLSRKIITENLLLIQKQESQLHSIPNFGKSDPRYQQAYNERLRCQGRITLYTNTINTIKNQIKLLPNRIYFYRLGREGRVVSANARETETKQVKGEGDLGSLTPWTLSTILPSIWFVEELIRLGHSIYLYSGSFFHSKDDGPTKDSLSGTLGTILMGRLYHMKGIDAIFQWQKSHDFMKILHQQLDDSEKRKIVADAAAGGRDGDVDGNTGSGREEGSIRNPFIPPPVEIPQKKEKKRKPSLSSSSVSFRNPVTKQSSSLVSSSSSSSSSFQSFSANPTLSTLKQHGTHLLYRVSCPSLSWQKALILDVLDNYSMEWMKYPIIRSQLTPEIYSILERNHYDITLRNQNVYHELVDYYTSQAYLPFSFQNYRFSEGENGKTGSALVSVPSKNPLLSASLSSQRTTRKLMTSSSSASLRSTNSGLGGGITVRGDPLAEDDGNGTTEQEENETIIRLGDRMTISSFSLNKKGVIASTHPLSSSLSTTIDGGSGSNGNHQQSGKARTVNIHQTISSRNVNSNGNGNRGRMTILQKMKLQLQNEENQEQLQKEKEAKEKESFNSIEYKEANRQEMILNKSSNYRGKQSIYLEGVVDGNGNKIVHSSSSAAVLNSIKHQSTASSFGGGNGFSRPSSASSACSASSSSCCFTSSFTIVDEF